MKKINLEITINRSRNIAHVNLRYLHCERNGITSLVTISPAKTRFRVYNLKIYNYSYIIQGK